MKTFFNEDASLPSLPSDSCCVECEIEMTQAELREYEQRQLCWQCAASLPMTEDNREGVQRTLMLLSRKSKLIIQNGSRIPFSLSAAGLANEVRQCDCLGPAKLGFYYEQRLMDECRFLIPREISGDDILAFYRVMETWNRNRSLFQCNVIGAILTLKMALLNKKMEA